MRTKDKRKGIYINGMLWHAECDGCPNGHPTFWETVITSPQWIKWEKEVSKRMNKKTHDGVWDVDESRETNVISQEHFQDFIKFIKKMK